MTDLKFKYELCVFQEAEIGEEDFVFSINVQKGDLDDLKEFSVLALLSEEERNSVIRAKFLLKKEEILRFAFFHKLRKKAKKMNVYLFLLVNDEKDREIVKALYEKEKEKKEIFQNFLKTKGINNVEIN